MIKESKSPQYLKTSRSSPCSLTSRFLQSIQRRPIRSLVPSPIRSSKNEDVKSRNNLQREMNKNSKPIVEKELIPEVLVQVQAEAAIADVDVGEIQVKVLPAQVLLPVLVHTLVRARKMPENLINDTIKNRLLSQLSLYF
jgi:hypothetical protein